MLSKSLVRKQRYESRQPACHAMPRWRSSSVAIASRSERPASVAKCSEWLRRSASSPHNPRALPRDEPGNKGFTTFTATAGSDVHKSRTRLQDKQGNGGFLKHRSSVHDDLVRLLPQFWRLDDLFLLPGIREGGIRRRMLGRLLSALALCEFWLSRERNRYARRGEQLSYRVTCQSRQWEGSLR